MTKAESGWLSPEQAQEKIEADRQIDGFFAALSRGESPKVEELDFSYLKEILVDADADLEPSLREEALGSLSKMKYTEAHPNRRLGCEIVWGPVAVENYEGWALEMSENTCPRNIHKGKPIEGSQSRGLKQLLADLTELSLGGGMSLPDFVRRTDIRVRRGLARKNKTEMPESDLAMIPDGTLLHFWIALRNGHLPPLKKENS